MAKDLIDQIKQRVLITDGAMGTMLQSAGLPVGACGEQWNVTEKAKVQAIHKAYFEAGGRCRSDKHLSGKLLPVERVWLGHPS